MRALLFCILVSMNFLDSISLVTTKVRMNIASALKIQTILLCHTPDFGNMLLNWMSIKEGKKLIRLSYLWDDLIQHAYTKMHLMGFCLMRLT